MDGQEKTSWRIALASFALVAVLVWLWGRSHTHALIWLGDRLRRALGAPPAEDGILAHLAALGRESATCQRCVRRALPRAFDPDLHGDRVAAANACLERGDGGSYFGAFEFGYDARNQLPLFVEPGPTPGCVQRSTTRVAIGYRGLNEASCRCVGRPYYGVGESSGYSGCAAMTTWQWFAHAQEATRDVRSALSFAPFGIDAGSWPSIVELSEGEAYLPMPARGFAGPVSFRLRALKVAQPDVRLPGRLEIQYRSVSHAAFDALFAEPILRELVECHKRAGSLRSAPRLAWGAGSESHVVSLPPDCEDLARRFEAALRALPEITCASLPDLPLGGVGCLPETRTAPFLALRRDLVELRALTPGLADALCVAVARVLVGPGS